MLLNESGKLYIIDIGLITQITAPKQRTTVTVPTQLQQACILTPSIGSSEWESSVEEPAAIQVSVSFVVDVPVVPKYCSVTCRYYYDYDRFKTVLLNNNYILTYENFIVFSYLSWPVKCVYFVNKAGFETLWLQLLTILIILPGFDTKCLLVVPNKQHCVRCCLSRTQWITVGPWTNRR